MTKVFTATAIQLLVQEGEISLDEPVTRILPQLPPAWSSVTLRHCLSHTTGLPDAVTDDINVTPRSGDWDALLAFLATLPTKPPGTQVAYNQTGYALLGMIIEKMSGMPYVEFVQRRILQAAHMDTARFGDAWSIIPGRSELYTTLDITADHTKLLVKDGRPVVRQGQIYHYGAKFLPDYLAPAGGLNGSLQDLVHWEQALVAGTLLSSDSLKAMTQPAALANGQPGPFGLAFLTGTTGGFTTVSYGGGAATWRLSIPARHLTVIVLTNLQGVQPQILAAEIATLWDPALAEH